LGAVLGGEDDDGFRHVGVGDKNLGAVKEIGTLAFGGSGLQGSRIRAAPRFGQGPGGDSFAGGQRGYQPLLLLFIAKIMDGGGAQGEVGDQGDAGGRVPPGNFFGGDGDLAVASSAPAVFGVYPNTSKA
jgi:hypothetical protein